jgi:hypothetical protein
MSELPEVSQPRTFRVRVHAGHHPHCFVVHIVAGIVDAVTAQEYRALLGLSELDCRDTLKAMGIKTFVDLDSLEARAARGFTPYPPKPKTPPQRGRRR